MNDFFTLQSQAQFYGWINSVAAVGVLILGLTCFLRAENGYKHIYTAIGITSFFALGFHLCQLSFAFIILDAPEYPYIQFVRSLFFVGGLIGIVRTMVLIFQSDG